MFPLEITRLGTCRLHHAKCAFTPLVPRVQKNDPLIRTVSSIGVKERLHQPAFIGVALAIDMHHSAHTVARGIVPGEHDGSEPFVFRKWTSQVKTCKVWIIDDATL